MHLHQSCNCNDLEAQPCVSALIEEYLDTLRWNVLTDGADGRPGDPMDVGRCKRNIDVTTRGFHSLAELEQWLSAYGVGYFTTTQRRSS
jgi:hypothetical protein